MSSEPWTRRVESLLDDVGDRGAALAILRGPGAGCSRLPSHAARMAGDRGLRVLATRPGDADGLPYAGLHGLLRPVLSHVDALAATQSYELRVALGLAAGMPAEPFRIAFAVLELLAEAANDDPLVLIAEGVHRLDRGTADVLCIVARWLRPTDPVVVLLSGRAARSSVLSGPGLEQLKLGTFGAGPPWPKDGATPPRHPARPRARSGRCETRRCVP